MVQVHHRVADLQLRQVLDQRIDVADLLLLAPPARSRVVAKSSVSVTNWMRVACLGLVPVEALGQRRSGDGHLLVAV